jgi:hypothetical protein
MENQDAFIKLTIDNLTIVAYLISACGKFEVTRLPDVKGALLEQERI